MAARIEQVLLALAKCYWRPCDLVAAVVAVQGW